jgi:hypothetical protein
MKNDLTHEQISWCRERGIDPQAPLRKRYRYTENGLQLVSINGISLLASSPSAPYIQPDIPGYESPIDGRWIEGRRARREDLKRSNSRPWEGLEQEKKEAARFHVEREKKDDALAEKIAHRLWAEAPESARKLFRSK